MKIFQTYIFITKICLSIKCQFRRVFRYNHTLYLNNNLKKKARDLQYHNNPCTQFMSFKMTKDIGQKIVIQAALMLTLQHMKYLLNAPSPKTLFSIYFPKTDIVKRAKWPLPCQKSLHLVRKPTLTPQMQPLNVQIGNYRCKY